MTNPFAFKTIKSPLVRQTVKKILATDTLERWYDRWLAHASSVSGDTAIALSDFILDEIGVDMRLENADLLDQIPKVGAFMAVANHPMGGVEGMFLTAILKRVRPDLKVLTNEILTLIPEYSDVFIGVDALNADAGLKNAQGIRQMAKHLSQGKALLVFPAGTVSQMELPSFKVKDAPWKEMIFKMAQRYKATLLPIFVNGQNTKSFYLSGYIHKRLRTALLPRAMIKSKGQEVRCIVGNQIPASDLQRINDPSAATAYVRLCCEALGVAKVEQEKTITPLEALQRNFDISDVKKHLETLEDTVLARRGDLVLYCAPYDRMGPILQELSIERERTFRAAGEGTGRALDTDQFDPHYMHLFMWDKAKNKIAGGYRLGKTDEIIKAHGIEGLYSYSLFSYKKDFLKKLENTIEVGRSFISSDYQRNPLALDLLWKGIGAFVVKNPSYHTLFGCVSISSDYSKVARAMLSDVLLSQHSFDAKTRAEVTPRTPLKLKNKPWDFSSLHIFSEIPIVNKLVGRIDAGKTIPVLIRQYLALNGKFLSFTVNTGFNDSLDGLIFVDLRNSNEKYLKRYMGQDGVESFKAYWGINDKDD